MHFSSTISLQNRVHFLILSKALEQSLTSWQQTRAPSSAVFDVSDTRSDLAAARDLIKWYDYAQNAGTENRKAFVSGAGDLCATSYF